MSFPHHLNSLLGNSHFLLETLLFIFTFSHFHISTLIPMLAFSNLGVIFAFPVSTGANNYCLTPLNVYLKWQQKSDCNVTGLKNDPSTSSSLPMPAHPAMVNSFRN